MTKPLSSFPQSERERVAERRVAANTGGLGYLSARDWVEKGKPKKTPKPKEKEE